MFFYILNRVKVFSALLATKKKVKVKVRFVVGVIFCRIFMLENHRNNDQRITIIEPNDPGKDLTGFAHMMTHPLNTIR